jgi:RND family efflux transporter MFP subunit
MTQPVQSLIRRGLGLLVVAAVVVGGALYWPQLVQLGRAVWPQTPPAAPLAAPASAPAEAAAPAAPRTAPVAVVSAESTVEAAGSVSAVQSGPASWKTSGNVAKVFVQNGDHVQAGQPLMTLDPLSAPQAVILAAGQVVSTQRVLDDLMKPPSLTVASAQQNLARAADTLSSAQKTLGYLTSPDMKYYTTQVQQAQDAVINAQQNATLVDIGQLQVNLRNAQKGLETATNVYNNARDGFAKCPSCEKVWAYDRMTNWADAQNLYNDAVNLVQQIQTSIDQAQRGNSLAITNAQDALDKATRNLNWIKQGPESVKLQLDQANVALAQAAVADAQDKLNHLLNGPDPRDLAVLESALQAAQATVNTLTLTAPFDGDVLVVNNLPGDGVTSGQAALLLADRSTLRVDAQVDETDISQITVGTPVTVTFDALPGVALAGKVTWINPSGSMLQGLVKYTVRAELTQRDPHLLLGMTAHVSIVVQRQAQALAVPLAAVQHGPEGDFVQRVRAGLTEAVPVTRGPRQGDQVVVTGALKAGDQVVLVAGR